jgi:hypothetical protein
MLDESQKTGPHASPTPLAASARSRHHFGCATTLDNGQRSPRKLLAAVVRRLVLAPST